MTTKTVQAPSIIKIHSHHNESSTSWTDLSPQASRRRRQRSNNSDATTSNMIPTGCEMDLDCFQGVPLLLKVVKGTCLVVEKDVNEISLGVLSNGMFA